MLEDLRRTKCEHYRSLPFLGPVLDGFDDWIRLRGYTLSTRRYYLTLLKHIEHYLQAHHGCALDELTAEDWEACRRWFAVRHSHSACAVTTLRHYLQEIGRIAASGPEDPDLLGLWVDRYAQHLGKVRGFEPKTIREHSFTIARFLEQLPLGPDGFVASSINSADVESFIDASSSIRSRATMHHVVAHVRGFLRFLEVSEHLPPALRTQIDTPRLYRLEKLPRALAWDVVKAFLESIERAGRKGIRDHAIFTLMAQYGLRSSEIISLSLDDIRWRSRRIYVSQRKNKKTLTLPLTDLAATALYRYLREMRRTSSVHREVFLASRAPFLPMKGTGVSEAFRKRVLRSGLNIPPQGPHCLRHSYAVHLLRQGTSLKQIGDLLGHRLAESTCMYLRLAVEDLREVALPLPRAAGREADRCST